MRRLSVTALAAVCVAGALSASAVSSAQAGEWQNCGALSVTASSGTRYRLTGLEARQLSCDFATEIAYGFYAQEIGSSGATEVEGLGCAYGAGDRVRCSSRSGNSYGGPQRVRWGQRAPGGPDPSSVAACRSFTVFKGHSTYSGHYTYRASRVRRSAAISCSMTRKLLKAAYHQGPLHVTRTVYAHSHGHPVGRPTYWLRGGWRCSNGAGGALCWNVRRRRLNAVHFDGVSSGFAVSADVGFVG